MAVALSALLPCLLLGGINRVHAATRQQNRPCIFDQQNLKTESGACRPHALAYPPQVRGRVRRAIYDSALIFGVPYKILLAIGRCESGLNPRANNGTHFGLFQFAPDTFRRGARALRHDTGIAASSYWRARDSAYVAGYLFATGRAPSWACE
ncbi:MAG: transglycosylase SLT domain-containing protein [Chloroflexota bacterium]